MRTVKAGAAYFALVFVVGFVLGVIRTLWVLPRVGVRSAELMESPLMFVATILAARWTIRQWPGGEVATGAIALALMLAAEAGVAIGIRREGLTEYIASRDPVSGTVYVFLLLLFGTMPLILSVIGTVKAVRGGTGLLDAFIPLPDIEERHEILVSASAPVVFEAARDFDIQSIAAVQAIFWLRGRLLGARSGPRRSTGFIADMLALGWQRLGEQSGSYFIAGAACQPWKADVKFMPIRVEDFASFREPDLVKIAWSLEVEPLSEGQTRLSTETRAVATDDSARRKFRSYWRRFRIGIVTIRRLLLSAIRRAAEAREAAQVSR